MSIAIIVMNNGPLEELYTLNLKLYVGVDIIPKKSATEALGLLQHLPKVDLILIMDKIDQEHSAEIIHKFITEKKREVPIPLIIFTDDNKNYEKMGSVLPIDAELKTVIKSVAKILRITSKDMMSQVVPDYYPMDIKYFANMSISICDAFVQVRQDDENFQYAKVIDAQGKIDQSTVSDFMKRGVHELFVQASYRLKFVNEFSKQLVNRLKDENLSVDQRMNATEYAQDFVYSQLKSLNFEEETVSLAKESIKSLATVVEDMPNLEALLKNLLGNPASFQFKHCQLNTYICTHVVKNMDWGSAEQSEKLTFVSFFHDIFLTSDDQVKIGSEEELSNSKLTDDQKAVVKKHAYMASDLINKMPQVPFGADTIIKEHHGNRNGIGLDPSFAANISPLAMVFMIAEEYTCALLGASGKVRAHEDIIKGLYKKFDKKPKYLLIIKALEKLKK